MEELYEMDLQADGGLFHYIICHPKIERMPTYFNAFPRELMTISGALDIIEELPTHILEYSVGWPQCADWRLDYKAVICDVLGFEANMAVIEKYQYGCIFFLPGIDDITISKCIGITKHPVISESHPDTINYSNDNITSIIHQIWKNQYPKMNWNLNQSNYTGIRNICSSISMVPFYSTLNRLRGAYSGTKDGLYLMIPGEDFKKYEENEGREIVKGIKSLLSEKLLTSILCDYIKGKNEAYEFFQKKLCFTDNDIKNIYEKNWDTYMNTVESIMKNDLINELSTDMVLLVNSANYPMVKYKNECVEKRKRIPNKLLKTICDANGYFPLYDLDATNAYSEEKTILQNTYLMDMIDDRNKEQFLLNRIYVLYALGRRLPYITSRNIPTSQFYEEAYVISEISEFMEKTNNIPRFTEGIQKLKDIMSNAYPKEVINAIKLHGQHIKVLSDMPLEWMELDGVPLFIHKTVSRVPITSGGMVIRNHINDSYDYELNIDNVNFLILNALEPGDSLYKYGRYLNKVIHYYFAKTGVKVNYKEVASKDGFIKAIEDTKPAILIYYGHGDFDKRSMKGALVIRSGEKVLANDILQLKHNPLITILGACNTHVMNGAYQNIANLMLSAGCISVLGTFFPIDGKLAYIYVSSLIKSLSERLMGIDQDDNYENWTNIIQMTQKMIYQMEPLIALEKHLKSEKLSMNKLLEYFTSYCDEHEIYGIERYVKRDEIYEKIFVDFPKLHEKFCRVKPSSIIPLSLYYSSLGAPEKIKIKPAKQLTKDEIALLEKYFDGMFD